MNEGLTAIFEYDGDDGCIDLDPKLADASPGTALAQAPAKFFEGPPAGVFDEQSCGDAASLIADGSGLRFE